MRGCLGKAIDFPITTPSERSFCCFLWRCEPSISTTLILVPTLFTSLTLCSSVTASFIEIGVSDGAQHCYLSTSLAFFQDVGTIIPWHSSHRLNACTARGSSSFAPGISSSVMLVQAQSHWKIYLLHLQADPSIEQDHQQ